MISTTELGTCVAVCKVLAPFRSTAKMQATIAVPNGFSWAISAIATPSKPKPEPKPEGKKGKNKEDVLDLDLDG